jgi:radical SAM enzyme (TIGR01210 family)
MSNILSATIPVDQERVLNRLVSQGLSVGFTGQYDFMREEQSEVYVSLPEKVRQLYDEFGQRKPMGSPSRDDSRPHYFLQRTFLGEQDLVILFNTKRCRYQCHFCNLPDKSRRYFIPTETILLQFEYVLTELKHSLSILDRLTISNEGSVLDKDTFPREALLTIARASYELRRVRTLVLETRLEFLEPDFIRQIMEANPRAKINVLTGFETLDSHIRDNVLVKRESIDTSLAGLDKIANCGASLTAYVLFKPGQAMTDEQAIQEAEASIDFLVEQCRKRNIPLTIRLNPMYAAIGSRWESKALELRGQGYAPPRLTDVLSLARKKRQEKVNIYIGLSTEGLSASWGDYTGREDFSPELLKEAVVFNSHDEGNE